MGADVNIFFIVLFGAYYIFSSQNQSSSVYHSVENNIIVFVVYVGFCFQFVSLLGFAFTNSLPCDIL